MMFSGPNHFRATLNIDSGVPWSKYAGPTGVLVGGILDHCWHVVHDLEANGFFIDLMLASRHALRQGLLGGDRVADSAAEARCGPSSVTSRTLGIRNGCIFCLCWPGRLGR